MRETPRRFGPPSGWLALPLLAALAVPAAGQIPIDFPVVGVSPAGEGCPGPSSLSLPTSVPDLGLVDVWVYPHANGDPVEAARFGLTWPAEWSLQEFEVCRGVFLENQFSGPPTPVSLDFEGSTDGALPALRLRFDATVPGRCSITRNPITDEYRFSYTFHGEWYDYYEGGAFWFAVVGPLACVSPLGPPPDLCGFLIGDRAEPGLTESFFVNLGESHTDTVTTHDGPDCMPNLYCNPIYAPYPCQSQPYSRVPWVTFAFIDNPTPSSRRHLRTIHTAGLGTGMHVGEIGDSADCVMCQTQCHAVRLTVLPPRPVEPTSWGRIKATYRGEE